MATILIVDDDRKLAHANFLILKHAGHTVHVAYTLRDGIRAMENHVPEIILCDLVLENDSGIELLAASRRQRHLPDVVLVTGHPTQKSAEEAMHLGAYEYMTKPYSSVELTQLVRRILERRALLATRRARQRKARAGAPLRLVARDPVMRELMASLDDVAPRNTTVLLRGETGAGKEILTQYIHEQGPNPGGPFVAINCAAIPETLLASELFGHQKGAFTGADSTREGAFERASGGTLLLDEIGDIPLSTQVHLLRVIESAEVLRVGGSRAVPVSPRLVAATHRDVEALVRQGAFREDLYYRINVYSVFIPPLRERPEDIPELARFFLEDLDADPGLMTDDALESMKSYHWPGNVRELRNMIENLVIRSHGNPISGTLLRSILSPLQQITSGTGEEQTLEAIEARRIREAIELTGGNKTRAAEALGISRRKLYSRMKILGMQGG